MVLTRFLTFKSQVHVVFISNSTLQYDYVLQHKTKKNMVSKKAFK